MPYPNEELPIETWSLMNIASGLCSYELPGKRGMQRLASLQLQHLTRCEEGLWAGVCEKQTNAFRMLCSQLRG